MKYLKSKIYVLLLACIGIACEKEEERVILTSASDPVLSVSSTGSLVLAKAQENFTSLQFQWTNPEYGFSNGVNTQDVSYTLEIDTVGSNFSNPKQSALTFTNNLSTTFLVKELNNALAVMELKDFYPHNFEFRIKATLAGGSVPVYSNKVQITISTYLDVVYPVPTNLYITGAATPASWMGGGDPELLTQKFTKVNSYKFEIASLMINSNSPFLFVPVYGNWDNKYGFTGAKEANNVNGDSFKPGGEDLKSPGVAKAYKITVNFKTGRYTFE